MQTAVVALRKQSIRPGQVTGKCLLKGTAFPHGFLEHRVCGGTRLHLIRLYTGDLKLWVQRGSLFQRSCLPQEFRLYGQRTRHGAGGVRGVHTELCGCTKQRTTVLCAQVLAERTPPVLCVAFTASPVQQETLNQETLQKPPLHGGETMTLRNSHVIHKAGRACPIARTKALRTRLRLGFV